MLFSVVFEFHSLLTDIDVDMDMYMDKGTDKHIDNDQLYDMAQESGIFYVAGKLYKYTHDRLEGLENSSGVAVLTV